MLLYQSTYLHRSLLCPSLECELLGGKNLSLTSAHTFIHLSNLYLLSNYMTDDTYVRCCYIMVNKKYAPALAEHVVYSRRKTVSWITNKYCDIYKDIYKTLWVGTYFRLCGTQIHLNFYWIKFFPRGMYKLYLHHGGISRPGPSHPC